MSLFFRFFEVWMKSHIALVYMTGVDTECKWDHMTGKRLFSRNELQQEC